MRLIGTVALLFFSLAGRAQKNELAALLKRERVTGMQLMYTKGGTVTAYNLGFVKAGTKQAVTASTTFQAASLGKQMLAYVALRLHDRGVLELDKPLLEYYNYPRLAGQPNADKITARMVLAHSAGLPNWAENPLAASWKTSALRLRYAPDSCWNYSGEGYVFLQKTLEHLTGQSFEELAQAEVFEPLQLKNSSFVWRDKFAATACFGHNQAGKPTEIQRFAEANAGFSLMSNAADYNRFLQAVATGRGLKPVTAQLLTTAANPANRCGLPAGAADPRIAWACGVGLANTDRGPAQWQWGDNGDFKGFFLTLPAKKESVLFLTNSANGLKITDEVLRLFLGPGKYWAMEWLGEQK